MAVTPRIVQPSRRPPLRDVQRQAPWLLPSSLLAWLLLERIARRYAIGRAGINKSPLAVEHRRDRRG